MPNSCNCKDPITAASAVAKSTLIKQLQLLMQCTFALGGRTAFKALEPYVGNAHSAGCAAGNTPLAPATTDLA